jgi:NADP-dependent 3-hydroxy acid dehydrogenase YdfG
MDMNFDGKAALVIGAAGGLGRQAAISLARAGARVLVTDRDGDGIRETCGLIRAAGGEAFSLRYEVSPSFEAEALLDRARELFGAIDFACLPTSPGRMQLVEVIPRIPESKAASRGNSPFLSGLFKTGRGLRSA